MVISFRDLSNNELENLPPHIFRNVTAVEFLKMDYNKIERLPEDQFQGLVKLSELYLSENKIEALPDNIFKDVKNLKALTREAKAQTGKKSNQGSDSEFKGRNREAENDEQGHFGNEGAHANNEEGKGEHIEMQEIEYHEVPEEEVPEFPDLQLAGESKEQVGSEEIAGPSDK
ncbi:Leucine-rich repeat-containing G-protein coupled receptor 4, partial [Stylophora pistillata]